VLNSSGGTQTPRSALGSSAGMIASQEPGHVMFVDICLWDVMGAGCCFRGLGIAIQTCVGNLGPTAV